MGFIGAMLGGVLAIGAASAAWAEDPIDFGATQVYDVAGVLGGTLNDVEQRVVSAGTRSGRQLFVVFVDRFTNPTNAEEWATETATRNSLGTQDYLLVVAVEGRSYFFSAANGESLGPAAVQRIATDVIEPRLRESDWADAAVDAAKAIADADAGSGGGAATPDATPRSWFSGVFWLLPVGAAIVVIVLVSRRRRTRTAGTPSGRPLASIDDLRKQAGGALVATDDAIKTSTEELGFATASFGEDAAKPFAVALDDAQQHLSQAFTLQQQLDDSVPDTDAQRREWYGRILELCAAANETLDAQTAAFDELRKLQSDAPAALEQVRTAAAAARAGIEPARQKLASLGALYAPSALSSVADNVASAASRLTFADAAIQQAAAEISTNNTGNAAVEIRAAEAAVDQAIKLTTAIEKLGIDLPALDQSLQPSIANVRDDVRAARVLDGIALGDLATRVESEAAEVAAAASRPGRDPIALAARLEHANAAIDQAIAGTRSAQEAAARLQQQVVSKLAAARASISVVDDFIATRRGGIGSEARTRIAEAQRLLASASARAATDPAAALADATRAEQLAGTAQQLAQQDLYAQQPFGLPQQRSGGSDLLGAIIGGILINGLLGGGGHHGGGHRGGGFGGGGGFSPGSFGGSGSSGRFGSGGRF